MVFYTTIVYDRPQISHFYLLHSPTLVVVFFYIGRTAQPPRSGIVRNSMIGSWNNYLIRMVDYSFRETLDLSRLFSRAESGSFTMERNGVIFNVIISYMVHGWSIFTARWRVCRTDHIGLHGFGGTVLPTDPWYRSHRILTTPSVQHGIHDEPRCCSWYESDQGSPADDGHHRGEEQWGSYYTRHRMMIICPLITESMPRCNPVIGHTSRSFSVNLLTANNVINYSKQRGIFQKYTV